MTIQRNRFAAVLALTVANPILFWAADNQHSVTRDSMVFGPYLTGSVPGGIAFDGSSVWISNLGSGTVTKLNASNGSLLDTIQVSSPGVPAFDGANMWIPNSGSSTVTKIRVSDDACVGTCVFSVGQQPVQAAFDGANIWIVNQSSNTLSKL